LTPSPKVAYYQSIVKGASSVSEASSLISRKRNSIAVFALLFVLVTVGVISLIFINGDRAFAGSLPKSVFERYIESNSRFGTKFFKDLRAEDPDGNIVFSPIGVSSLFACLREAAGSDIRGQLDRAFEWTSEQELGPPNRLLRARFIVPAAPLPEKVRKREAKRRYLEHTKDLGKAAPDFASYFQWEEDLASWLKEEFWLTNSLLFQGRNIPNDFSERFLEAAKKNFGLEFKEISDRREWEAYVSRFPEAKLALDSDQSGLLFILNNVVRLGTKWKGGIFEDGPKPGEFHPKPGSTVSASMLLSKQKDFQYAATDIFEAIMLPAENAEFTVAMPRKGATLEILEAALAENPNYLLSHFGKRFGDVELPEFDLQSEHYLRTHLKNLGVEEVFRDLGDLVKVPKSRLLGVRQAASIKIDKLGIQAEARTDVLGVEGGIEESDQAFHMKVDRPFIFLVHDNITGVLLYMGAVIDPSRH